MCGGWSVITSWLNWSSIKREWGRSQAFTFTVIQSKWSAAERFFRPLTLNLLAVFSPASGFHHSWKERWTGQYLSPQETNEGFCIRIATLRGRGTRLPSTLSRRTHPLPSRSKPAVLWLCVASSVIDYWWPAGCKKREDRWCCLGRQSRETWPTLMLPKNTRVKVTLWMWLSS